MGKKKRIMRRPDKFANKFGRKFNIKTKQDTIEEVSKPEPPEEKLPVEVKKKAPAKRKTTKKVSTTKKAPAKRKTTNRTKKTTVKKDK